MSFLGRMKAADVAACQVAQARTDERGRSLKKPALRLRRQNQLALSITDCRPKDSTNLAKIESLSSAGLRLAFDASGVCLEGSRLIRGQCSARDHSGQRRGFEIGRLRAAVEAAGRGPPRLFRISPGWGASGRAVLDRSGGNADAVRFVGLIGDLRQFGTNDADFARGFDADSNRLPFDAQDGDNHILADLNLLRLLPRENQHGLLLG